MFSSDLLLLFVVWLSSAYSCPDGQIRHFIADSRELRCCYAVLIDIGYEFVPCSKNGTKDNSIQCGEGMVQNDATSSEHEPYCYDEMAAQSCNSFDTKVIIDGVQKKCVCNGEKGFCGLNHLICQYTDCPGKKVHQNCSCMTTNHPVSTTSEDRPENTLKITTNVGIKKVTTPTFSVQQIQSTKDEKNQDGHDNGTGQHDINKKRSSEENKSDSDWLPILGYIGVPVFALIVGLILYRRYRRRNGQNRHRCRCIIGRWKFFKNERNEYQVVRQLEEDITSPHGVWLNFDKDDAKASKFHKKFSHKGTDKCIKIAYVKPVRQQREASNVSAGTPSDTYSASQDVVITVDNLLPDSPSPAASQEEVSLNPHFNDLNSSLELNVESLLNDPGPYGVPHSRETIGGLIPHTEDAQTILQQSSEDTPQGNGATTILQQSSEDTPQGNGAQTILQQSSEDTSQGNGAQTILQQSGEDTPQGNGANRMDVEALHNTVRKEPYLSTPANLPRLQLHTKAKEQNRVAAAAANSFENVVRAELPEVNSLHNQKSGPKILDLDETGVKKVVPQKDSSAQITGVGTNKTNEDCMKTVKMQRKMDSLQNHQSQTCQFTDIDRTCLKEVFLQTNFPTEHEQMTGVGTSKTDQDGMNKFNSKSLRRMKTAKNRKLNSVNKLAAASASNSGCPSQGKEEDMKQNNCICAMCPDETKISPMMPSPLCSSCKAFRFLNRSSSLSLESLLYSNSKIGDNTGLQVQTYSTVGRTGHVERELHQCWLEDSSLGQESMLTAVDGAGDAKVPNLAEFFSLHSLKSLVIAEYTVQKYKRSLSCPTLHQK